MKIEGITAWWGTVVKGKPAIPKVSPVTGSGISAGQDDETRERSDYSDRKKQEAGSPNEIYGENGKTHSLDDDTPRLDEMS